MSEVSVPKVELTPEQQVIFDEVEASIPDACEGCSTAAFTAGRIAIARTTYRRFDGEVCLGEETAEKLIERQRKCTGRCPISGYCQLGHVSEDQS